MRDEREVRAAIAGVAMTREEIGTRMTHLAGLPIYTSPFLGERIQVRFPPPTVKRYKQRTVKRYARDPRNWEVHGVGRFWMCRYPPQVWCHPDDLEILRAAIESAGKFGSVYGTDRTTGT